MDSKNENSICFLKPKSKKIIKLYKNKKFDLFTPYMKLKQYLDSLNENYENYYLEDFLIYGINCEKIKDGKKIDIILYLSEYDESEIILLEKISGTSNSIDLNKLLDISFDINESNNIYFNDNNNNNNNNNLNDKKKSENKNKNSNIDRGTPVVSSNLKISLDINTIKSNNLILKNINLDKKKYISLCISEYESYDLIFKSEQIFKIFVVNIFSLYKKSSIENKGKTELNLFKKYLIKI